MKQKSKYNLKIVLKTVGLSVLLLSTVQYLNPNEQPKSLANAQENLVSTTSSFSQNKSVNSSFNFSKNQGIDILNSSIAASNSISTSTSVSKSISVSTSISTANSITEEENRKVANQNNLGDTTFNQNTNQIQNTPGNFAPSPTLNQSNTAAPANLTSVAPTPTPAATVTLPPAPIPAPEPEPVPAAPTSSLGQYFGCGGNYYDILNQINEYRSQNGLSALVLDSTLSNAACYYSNWMNDNWANSSPKLKSHFGDGNSPYDRCVAYGSYCNGEVLAYTGNQTGANLVTLWKNSPSHNAVLLGSYSSVGFGIMGNYVTADFK